LIERAAANWKLVSERKFSMPGERMVFQLEPESPDSEQSALPAQWEIVRLEDQSKTNGSFKAADRKWTLTLDKPGSYSLLLRDKEGRLIAAAAHWVGGRDDKAQEIKVLPGTIEMVPNKERYKVGETAEVLITFSDPVDEALFTLERDRVEASALLSAALGKNANWVSAERLAPNQWRARIAITETHAPNVTFSVAYVKAGEYVFQNAGLVVETPRLALDIKPGKTVVKPGESVEVVIDASLNGKPARAMLTVSVVDEMIYALQPEIAPDMVEFFQHVRRNNVRTGASLNFITYDEAVNYAGDAGRQAPDRHQYNERSIKVLERARRDDTDTAAWMPTLITDEKGRAKFTFKMPDALSRWRITVRAVALEKEAAGNKATDVAYGQRAIWMQSDKPLYAKWTSPVWMREGDAPVAALALFNNTNDTREAEIALKLADKEVVQKASLSRGVTYLSFKLPPFTGTQDARLEVYTAGRKELVDALETSLTAEPASWRGVHEQAIHLERGTASLKLPADASRVRLRFVASGSEHFLRIGDSLLEYPWGCVEQTASRLIPLSIITPLLSTDRAQGKAARLRQTLYSQRLRLAALAGPKAVFGWWGRGTDDNTLMTAYAYYADWRAARALGVSLPASHWERVLVVYRDQEASELERALALWFIQQIGLPVRTQAEGSLAALAKDMTERVKQGNVSPLLDVSDPALGLAYAQVLTALVAQEAGSTSRPDARALEDARQRLQASGLPSARALLLLSDKSGTDRDAVAAEILASISEETPTFDRALTLVWTQQALGGKLALQSGDSGLKPADSKWQNVAAATHALVETPEWLWPANTRLPDTVQVQNAPDRLTAMVRYESEENNKSALPPVTIERQLYRLERESFEDGIANYELIPVDPGDGLSPQELYLDEISLASKQPNFYGIVEVPLPPGASVEHSTWGIRLDGEAIDRSTAEEQRDRYGVPVESLSDGQNIVVRHLLRVGQSGRFTLPPTRYYRMYQPELKAYSEEKNASWVVK
ncbi:MAG: alpha-2-macroglobulin family protein, partial [Zoogloeaceae bacterium]|nr:alpha-2-macroglobulin family protein [Zoogloeaceae bacterium]